MQRLTLNKLKELLHQTGKPCVSLYMPTHGGGSEQERIQWKNLVAEAEAELTGYGLRLSSAHDLLKPAMHLPDASVWEKRGEGLACFLTPGSANWYRLPAAISPQVHVGSLFQIKPLFPLLESERQFWLLTLSQEHVKLWRGDAEALQETPVPGLPMNMADALRNHDRDEPLHFHTRPVGSGWAAIFHGQGVGIDDLKDDLLRYFQAIDRAVGPVLGAAKAPLILAGVDYLWPIYRQANHYRHLLPEGVPGNPDRWSPQQLRDKAWKCLLATYNPPAAEAVALYARLAGTGRTCAERHEVVLNGCLGKLETLFVPVDQQAFGTFDGRHGQAELHATRQPGDEDLYNLAAIRTAFSDGTVYALPTPEVPSGTGQAGIFWLPLTKHR